MWMIVDTKINGWVISPVARQDLAITDTKQNRKWLKNYSRGKTKK